MMSALSRDWRGRHGDQSVQCRLCRNFHDSRPQLEDLALTILAAQSDTMEMVQAPDADAEPAIGIIGFPLIRNVIDIGALPLASAMLWNSVFVHWAASFVLLFFNLLTWI